MVKTIGDLFEENDDWVNDEEAVALERIVELKRDYIKNIGFEISIWIFSSIYNP